MSHARELEAVLTRLDALDPGRPCPSCARVRSIGRDIVFLTFFVLGMVAVLVLALVVAYAMADFPAHA